MDLKELPAHSFRRHPWEIARARFFARLVRENVTGKDLTVLDLGAGDGYVAERLLAEVPALAHVTCFDVGYHPSWLHEVAAHPRMTFTVRKPSGAYDLLVLLDVLEHVDDADALLDDAVRGWVAPHGLLLVSAPAWQALFSSHDSLLGHRRRFAPAELRALACKCGLDIVAHGQLFSSLVLPRALLKMGELLTGGGATMKTPPANVETGLSSWNHGRAVTALVTFALSLDAAGARLSSRLGIPTMGLSTWVLARRR